VTRLLTIAFSASLAMTAAATAGDAPAMPAFADELTPFVGTWRHMYRYKGKGKEIPLWLVIKDDGGQLRLRFQLPLRKTRTSSDWDGQIELRMQANMREKRRTTYRVELEPARIAFSELKTYSGTWKGRTIEEDGHYELTEDGQLQLVCRSRREKDEELPCYAPFIWARVSTDTEWPD